MGEPELLGLSEAWPGLRPLLDFPRHTGPFIQVTDKLLTVNKYFSVLRTMSVLDQWLICSLNTSPEPHWSKEQTWLLLFVFGSLGPTFDPVSQLCCHRGDRCKDTTFFCEICVARALDNSNSIAGGGGCSRPTTVTPRPTHFYVVQGQLDPFWTDSATIWISFPINLDSTGTEKTRIDGNKTKQNKTELVRGKRLLFCF